MTPCRMVSTSGCIDASFWLLRPSPAISSLDGGAVAMGNALESANGGRYVETSARAHDHPPDVDAGVLALGDDSPNEITGLETVAMLLARPCGARKAVLVGDRAGVCASPGCPGYDDLCRVGGHTIDSADANGVESMGLWHTAPAPVPLGAATRTRGHRQPGVHKRPVQRLPGGIDRRGVFERGLSLGENLLGDDGGLVGVEPGGEPGLQLGLALGLVARYAGQRQVGDPIGAA